MHGWNPHFNGWNPVFGKKIHHVLLFQIPVWEGWGRCPHQFLQLHHTALHQLSREALDLRHASSRCCHRKTGRGSWNASVSWLGQLSKRVAKIGVCDAVGPRVLRCVLLNNYKAIERSLPSKLWFAAEETFSIFASACCSSSSRRLGGKQWLEWLVVGRWRNILGKINRTFKSKSDLQKKSTNKNIFLESIVAHWILSGQNLAQITLARSLKQHGGWISSDIVGTVAPETFLCHKEQRYVYWPEPHTRTSRQDF